MDGGTWWPTVHGVTKSWTWLSDFTFTFHFHALEKEMATHFSVLVWRIRDGGAWWVASMGLHRVGQDWSDLAAASAATTLSYGLKGFPSTHVHVISHSFFFFFNKIAYVFSFWGLHSIPLYRILFKSGFSWCSFKLLVCELADTGLLWPITVKCIFFAPSQNHWTEFLKPRMEEFFLSTSTKILCYAKV